jgi:hypothetical protein
MDSGIALLLGVLTALVVLDLLALRFGADTRDGGRNWW